jgi:thiol-disulfide isomerase/thioredoxin
MNDHQSQLPVERKGIQFNNTILVGGLFLLAAALVVQEFVGDERLKAGHPAPPLKMTRLDGSTTLLSSLQGKVVLLNFWATWCPPCNDEMPELVAIAKAYESKGVVFVAANQEEPDEAVGHVGAWLEHHPEVRPYVVFTDPAAGVDFLVRALPTTYVIDAKGKVVQVERGQVEGTRVEKWLDDVLAAQ